MNNTSVVNTSLPHGVVQTLRVLHRQNTTANNLYLFKENGWNIFIFNSSPSQVRPDDASMQLLGETSRRELSLEPTLNLELT